MPFPVVLFDVDGTLLDTREFVHAAFEHAFRQFGVEPPARDVLAPHIGRPLEQIYAEFGPPERAADLVEAHRSFQVENLHLSIIYPGTAEVLELLRAEGVQMAAVTSRSRRSSLATLELAGIAAYFEAVISAEDTPALKPDPAPLLLALARMGREPLPGKQAMVGDTHNDVDAGKAIGAFTVGATFGFHGADVAQAGPDALIHDIRELPAALGHRASP
jgi:pyrophosphatase PpaX